VLVAEIAANTPASVSRPSLFWSGFLSGFQFGFQVDFQVGFLIGFQLDFLSGFQIGFLTFGFLIGFLCWHLLRRHTDQNRANGAKQGGEEHGIRGICNNAARGSQWFSANHSLGAQTLGCSKWFSANHGLGAQTLGCSKWFSANHSLGARPQTGG
jgi:hypothetical protein